MLRRFINATVLLVVLSACSIIPPALPVPSTAPSPVALNNTSTATALPTSVLATHTIEPRPTPSSDKHAIWLLDGVYDRQVAIDPETGQVLNSAPDLVGLSVLTKDHRWRYLLQNVHDFDQWHIGVVAQDLTRSLSPKHIALTDVPGATYLSSQEVQAQTLVLSADERQLVVVEAEKHDGQFITHVYVVDTVAGSLASTIDVWGESGIVAPHYRLPAQALFAPDGVHLWIAGVYMRTTPVKPDDPAVWLTRVSVINLKAGRPERTFDVPGDLTANSLGVKLLLAPDGQRLHLVQDVMRYGEPQRYGFTTFDLEQQELTFTRVVEPAPGDERSCGAARLHVTSDGHYLYGYCATEDPRRSAGYVQYFDTQTGLLDQRVVLASQANPTDPVATYSISYALPSPDGQWLYVVSWRSHELFVFDLAGRTVARSAVLKDPKPASGHILNSVLDVMAHWFIGTALAKFNDELSVLLSPDGQRLYVVDIKDLDKVDGLWAVETSTLKPLGHWLAGRDVSIRLIADGRELYASSPRDNTLYRLDPITGDVHRALRLEFKLAGFGTE